MPVGTIPFMVARPGIDADVRASILAAAIRTIEEEGLAGVSMREVARRAGVSHQLPYHYFTDREGILAAIAEAGFVELGAELRSVAHGPGTAAERFAACGRVYVAFACAHPAHFRVMFRPDFVALDRHPGAQQCADDAFAIVPEIAAALVAEGLPPEPNEQALVVLAWSLCHGLACLLLDGPLSKKLPGVEAAKEQTIGDVMIAMQRLVERSSRRPRG